MKDNTVVVLGGVLGALVVSTGLYLVKAAEIAEVAKQSQAETPEHVLAQRIAAMQADLTTFATDYTTELATNAAVEHLTNRLGVSPQQMNFAQRIGGVFSS